MRRWIIAALLLAPGSSPLFAQQRKPGIAPETATTLRAPQRNDLRRLPNRLGSAGAWAC
jgi:hypothetical protein